MSDSNAPTQSTIDPIYRNLTKGKTPVDKTDIILRNAFEIDVLCDLMAGFDTSLTDEPLIHANYIVQRLTREITLNSAGLFDYLRATEQEGSNE